MLIPPSVAMRVVRCRQTRLPIATTSGGASRSLGAMGNGVVAFGFAEDRGALRGAVPFARGVAPHVVGARGCVPYKLSVCRISYPLFPTQRKQQNHSACCLSRQHASFSRLFEFPWAILVSL